MADDFFKSPLHVAMQFGLYLHLPKEGFGVQSLRVPVNLGFL
jgi:hypothetical protein